MRAISHGIWLLFAVGACGQADSNGEPHSSSSSAIIGGTPSPSSQDFTVIIRIGDNSCTGTLVSPTLVLTAQHCLTNDGSQLGSVTENDYSQCTVGTNPVLASNVTVAFGANEESPTMTIPAANIYIDVDNDQCTKDIGFIELSQPVTGMTMHPIMLDSLVPINDTVTEVGYGADGSLDAGYSAPGVRQMKSGTVLLSGTKGSAVTPDGPAVAIPDGYVVSSITSCNGDSGSSIITNDTNSIVGLTIGGASTKVAVIEGYPQTDCEDSVLISAPPSANVPFVEGVFQSVGLMPWRTGQAQPPADLGGSCGQNHDCNSNYCVKVGAEAAGYCSRACTQASDCTNGTECLATGVADAGTAANVCLPPQPPPSLRGCSVPAPGAKTDEGDMRWWAAFVAAGCLLARRRSRRRSARNPAGAQ